MWVVGREQRIEVHGYVRESVIIGVSSAPPEVMHPSSQRVVIFRASAGHSSCNPPIYHDQSTEKGEEKWKIGLTCVLHTHARDE